MEWGRRTPWLAEWGQGSGIPGLEPDGWEKMAVVFGGSSSIIGWKRVELDDGQTGR